MKTDEIFKCHSESALIARRQVELNSNGSRKGIHLGPTATSFQADDFLNYKYPGFFLIKKYPELYGGGYFGGEGLKKLEIYSWSWQNKETSYLMEYLCYTKSVLVYGYLVISKCNCHSFWFWLRMEKLMKVCERKDISPFPAVHHPPTHSPQVWFCQG